MESGRRCDGGEVAMKWVTRERPKIDRIACPWLIARFIDKEPEFLYVPTDQVLKVAKETGATPYDIPGVEMSHVGELCSFDTFLKKYQLTDPALQQLAVIVSIPHCLYTARPTYNQRDRSIRKEHGISDR